MDTNNGKRQKEQTPAILGMRQAGLSDNRDDKDTVGVDHVNGIVPFVNLERPCVNLGGCDCD